MWRTLSHSGGWKSNCSYKQDLLSCCSASCCSWIMQQTDCTLCILTTLLLPPQFLYDDWKVFWCFCLRQISVTPELKATFRTSSRELVWLHIYKVFNWRMSEQQNVRLSFLEDEQQRCSKSDESLQSDNHSNRVLLPHDWESMNTDAQTLAQTRDLFITGKQV